MKYKALLLDVDGTLIPNKKEGIISPIVKNTINKASKKIHIGLATNRPLFLIEHLLPYLDIFGPSILNGGSQIIDVSSKKILWEKRMSTKDFNKIRSFLLKEHISFFVHDSAKDFFPPKNYVPKKLFNIVIKALDPKQADVLTNEISKIPTVSVVKTVSWTKGKIDLVVNHASATKQYAIFEVAKILKIKTHEIIGVGDGYNDFPLLMACGLKVAMGNAVDEIKAIADYVAPSVENDGVADIINRFVLKHT